MKTNRSILMTVTVLIAVTACLLAAEIYKYKCDKCGLILTFDKTHDYDSPRLKCPKDGTGMNRVP